MMPDSCVRSSRCKEVINYFLLITERVHGTLYNKMHFIQIEVGESHT